MSTLPTKPTAEDRALARFLRLATHDPIEEDAKRIAAHRRAYAERAVETVRAERDYWRVRAQDVEDLIDGAIV